MGFDRFENPKKMPFFPRIYRRGKVDLRKVWTWPAVAPDPRISVREFKRTNRFSRSRKRFGRFPNRPDGSVNSVYFRFFFFFGVFFSGPSTPFCFRPRKTRPCAALHRRAVLFARRTRRNSAHEGFSHTHFSPGTRHLLVQVSRARRQTTRTRSFPSSSPPFSRGRFFFANARRPKMRAVEFRAEPLRFRTRRRSPSVTVDGVRRGRIAHAP